MDLGLTNPRNPMITHPWLCYPLSGIYPVRKLALSLSRIAPLVNPRFPICDGAPAMVLAPPATPFPSDLPVHETTSFTPIGISEFASLNSVELTPLGSPIPNF
jgi:hypothetical protein